MSIGSYDTSKSLPVQGLVPDHREMRVCTSNWYHTNVIAFAEETVVSSVHIYNIRIQIRE
jgi:hypothetical protein